MLKCFVSPARKTVGIALAAQKSEIEGQQGTHSGDCSVGGQTRQAHHEFEAAHRGVDVREGAKKPLDLQRTVNEVIRPALKGSRVEWHGWHALRRGLATNLYELGVPNKVIQ